MKMSSAYCSRDVSKLADDYANDIISRKGNGETFPNMIYVVFFPEDVERYAPYNIEFFPIGDIYIGVDK